MPTTRTFIAIAASDAVRKRVVALATQLGRGLESVKWVAEQNLHFTLQFLGDVDDATVAGVCQTVAKTAAQLQPFEIQVATAGAFPSISRPRTLWVGVDRGGEAMIAVQTAITEALGPCDVHLDFRPFSPHLTIGRVRGRRGSTNVLPGRLADQARFDAGSMTVNHLTVFASELRRDGPIYHVLSQAVFGG